MTIPELGTRARRRAAGRRAHLQPHPRPARRAQAALPVPLDRLPRRSTGSVGDRSAAGCPAPATRSPTRSPAAVARLRALDLHKPPGVAEAIDWVGALDLLGLTSSTATPPTPRSAPCSSTARTSNWPGSAAPPGWPAARDPGPGTGVPLLRIPRRTDAGSRRFPFRRSLVAESATNGRRSGGGRPVSVDLAGVDLADVVAGSTPAFLKLAGRPPPERRPFVTADAATSERRNGNRREPASIRRGIRNKGTPVSGPGSPAARHPGQCPARGRGRGPRGT